MPGISLGILLENLFTAVPIIAYLWYEIHYGRINGYINQYEGVTDAVIALAQEHDNIDEDKVIDRLNGSAPSNLIVHDENDEVRDHG